jgi:hypothetical protein
MDDINIANTIQGQYNGLANQADAYARANYFNSAANQSNYALTQQQLADQTSRDFGNMLATHMSTSNTQPAPNPMAPIPAPNTSLSAMGNQPYNYSTSPTSRGYLPPTAQSPVMRDQGTAAPVNPLKSAIPLSMGSTPTLTPLADHSAVQSAMASTPNTNPDIIKATDPDNPTFASTHTWDSVDPKTGAVTHNTFNRQGLIDQMMNYTDKNGNHTMAGDANKLMSQFTISDAADAKTKADAEIAAHAQVLGLTSTLQYLRPDQQSAMYQNIKNRASAAGEDVSSWPTSAQDPNFQPWVAQQAEEARMNVNTATMASKRAEDSYNSLKAQAEAGRDNSQALEAQAKAQTEPSIASLNTQKGITEASIRNKNNADAFKAYQEGLKAKQEAAGGIGGGTAGALPAGQDAVQNYANAIIQGRATWPTNRELMDPAKSAGLKLALSQDPTLNQATFGVRQKAWQSSVSGPDGKALSSVDTAILHLGNFVNNAPSVPDAGSKPLNKIWQPFREVTSNAASDAMGKAAADQTTLANELETAYRTNGGSEKGVDYFQRMLNPALPLSTRLSNAREMSSLVMGKRGETVNKLNRAFPQGMGLNLPMDPEAQQALATINKTGQGTQAPVSAVGSVPMASTPAASSAPAIKVGQPAIKSNGQPLPDGQYHGFSVVGGKVSSVGQ